MDKKKYDDLWISILFLSSLVIFFESLKNYNFNILGNRLSYNILILPFLYYVTNYISKKYDYKTTIKSISITVIIMIMYNLVISFALGEIFNLFNILGDILGYFVSQVCNMLLYRYFINKEKKSVIFIYINYLFSLIIYSMFYNFVYLDMLDFDIFWINYFLILGIECFVALIVSIIDKKIIRNKKKT